MMEFEPTAEQAAAARIDASGLTVVRASEEELRAHEAYLDGMSKEAGGKIVWRR